MTERERNRAYEVVYQLLNRYLKVLCKELGINKNIHNHSARHTFGTIAMQVTDDITKLKDAYGHDSHRTTESYIREHKMHNVDDTLIMDADKR